MWKLSGGAKYVEVESTTSDLNAQIKLLEQANARLTVRCQGMLNQGMVESVCTDVTFVLDGGKTVLHAHWGMLCLVSSVLKGMFESGLAEYHEGRIMVPPEISMASFRGFLEFVYLGEWHMCLLVSVTHVCVGMRLASRSK